MYKNFEAASWLLTEDEAEDEEIKLDSETESDTESDTETETPADTEETEEDDDAIEDDNIVSAEDVADGETDIAAKLDNIEAKIDDLTADKTAEEDKIYDLDLNNPVCPCCGARLNISNETAGEEQEDIDDQIINNYGEEDAEGDTEGDETDEIETTGEPIDTMDDTLDTTQDIDVGTGEDYVDIDEILNNLDNEDDDEEK